MKKQKRKYQADSIIKLEDWIIHLEERLKTEYEQHQKVLHLIRYDEKKPFYESELFLLLNKIISNQNKIRKDLHSAISDLALKKLIPIEELISKVKMN
jgi:hypothetical protein